MKKEITSVVIIVLLIAPGGVMGKESKDQVLQSSAEIPVKFLFNQVVIELSGGVIVSGALVGIDSKTLIIKREGQDERIPSAEIKKVVIERQKEKNSYALSGMLFGTYLGNLVQYRARHQPTAFMAKDYSVLGLILWNAIIAGAGVGIGYLAGGLFEKDMVEFEFAGNLKNRQSQWEKMRRYILGIDFRQKRVHISVAGGQVMTTAKDYYEDLLETDGFYLGMGDMVSSLNLLRKLQLTVSISPRIEVGAAAYFLGEPSINGWKYTSPESYWVNFQLDTKGYYAIGIYKSLLPSSSRRISIVTGFGLGLMKTEFKLDTNYRWSKYPDYLEIPEEHTINKIFFCGVLFSELRFYLNNSLSMGLSADYIVSPTEKVPEFPRMNLPAKKIRLGNGSIGFNLGLHF